MKTLVIICIIIFYILISLNFVQGQGRGEDPTFVTGTGFNGTVTQILLQQDEKILVTGSFTEYNGTPANRIIRLNTDGSRDESFQMGAGFNITPQKILLQPDGKILACGNFTEYNGNSSKYIIRLNTDGTIDNSFQIGSSFTSVVTSIDLQKDNKIVLAGGGGKYKGDTCSYPVARLHPNGDIDTTFKADVSPFINSYSQNPRAFSVAIQFNDKIVVRGEFYKYVSGITPPIFKIDCIRFNMNGSLDSTFINYGESIALPKYLTSVNVQPDGKILVTGGSRYDMNSGGYIGFVERLYGNGNVDNSYKPYTNTVPSYSIIQPDGKIIIVVTKEICQENMSLVSGGYFGCKSKKYYKYIARYDSDGNIDKSFDVGVLFNQEIKSIVNQADGRILVGGDFTDYDGVTRNRIIRLINGSINTNEILISPNPTSNYINFSANPNSIWQITDTFGKVLMSGKIKEPNTQIDLRGLSHGMYIIHFTDTQGNKATKRIVKQ